ncbi:ChrR family anti-sigma-E factor [Paucibacter sp. JuS9]|uniref:ChrR family anti-sigma-E factor n=1 Tax=Roseateles TaxID=93681 RepID=UPI002FE63448
MIRHHPDDSLLMAQAAGRLDSGSALVLATHAEHCEQCRERLRSFDVLGGVLLEQLEPTALAEDALSRALSAIDAPETPPPHRPTPLRRAALPEGRAWPRAMEGCAIGPWRWMAPGMRFSRVTLPWDLQANVILLRIGAGKLLARHTHSDSELTQVLHGSFHDGRALFSAGDFDATDDSILHQPAVEPGGECVCLAAVSGRLVFESRVARTFGSLIGI